MHAMPTFELNLRRRRLDNGLEIVLNRDSSLPLVAVNLWYHVGSKNERPGRTGFAHLFEHLLFQGSQHVDTNDHFRLIQQAGGIGNGSTWYDRTAYYEVLPSHFLDLALWLESDRMGFFLPAITQEKLDNQRDVVINERRQRIDNQPYGGAFEGLHELLYPPGHPYRWPVIGYVDDIEAATLNDVSDFFSAHYVPQNAVLTVAGDIDFDLAFERVEAWFGDLEPGPKTRQPEPAPVLLETQQRAVLSDRVELPRVYLASHGPGFGSDSWYTADLLATVLSGGKSSALYADLVYDRQLAQEVGCFVLSTEMAAPFYTVATCRPGVEPEQLEQALGEHLAAAASSPPPAAEIERAQRQLLTQHFHQLQSLERVADLLSMFTTYFDAPQRVAEEVNRYRAIDAEALRNYAAEYLHADQRAVLTIVPEAAAASAAAGKVEIQR